MFAGKGQGKSFKGKGKSKGGSAQGGQNHKLPRERISAAPFSGTVKAWKGKFGFIQPDEEIEHEKAAQRGGALFFGMDDIKGAQMLAEGTPVEFHICEDESGLGAEEVVATGAATKGGGKGKSGKESSKGFGKDKGFAGKASVKGTSWAAPAKGAATWGKGVSPWMPTKGVKGGWSSPADKGKGFGKAKGEKGKGKADGNRGKGHLLPRTRITAEKFTGTVKAWKGKYGWVEPSEEVAHEKASKHNGSLFAGKDDIEGMEELTVGATVEFHIFEDSSGLGAEEIVQF